MIKMKLKHKRGVEMGLTMIVMIVLALAFLLTYSFLTKGFMYRFATSIGGVQSDSDLKIACIAGPEDVDADGDGFIDNDITVDGKNFACSKLKEK